MQIHAKCFAIYVYICKSTCQLRPNAQDNIVCYYKQHLINICVQIICNFGVKLVLCLLESIKC